MEEPDRALYIISVAAELAGVHAQTLRIYERKGLIEPRRTQGGSRRYSDRDIALLRRIQELPTRGSAWLASAGSSTWKPGSMPRASRSSNLS